MKYYLRLLLLLITQRRRSRCAPIGPCVSAFRVWPNDVDVFFHMNNGVYLTIADLGRTDLMLRSGIFGSIFGRGWYPVVAGETIRFRRSLRPFQRYTIATRVVGWTERSIYLEQTFESAQGLVARALTDIRFLGRRGVRVAPGEFLAELGVDAASPSLPDRVAAWAGSMRAMEGG